MPAMEARADPSLSNTKSRRLTVVRSPTANRGRATASKGVMEKPDRIARENAAHSARILAMI
jgi:hypothetical protein